MVMGFPGLDESVKFNVMKHLAKCCTEDKRPTVDENIKQEVALGCNVPTEERIGQLNKSELKLGELSQDAKRELLRGENKIIDSLLEHRNIAHRKVTKAKTMVEKRLMYQHLLSTVGSTRMGISADFRMQRSHYLSGADRYHNDDQKLYQFFPNLKSYSRNQSTLLWNDNNHYYSSREESLKNSIIAPSFPCTKATKLCLDNSNNATVTFKTPHNTCRSESSLVNPMPQLGESYLIRGGIKLMPATVLVPVQVGYASIDEFESNNQIEEQKMKRDVWRPWERVETVANHSKVKRSQDVFSI